MAKECAEWIRRKAKFKSNHTKAPMQQFSCVQAGGTDTAYMPLHGFTAVDLGYQDTLIWNKLFNYQKDAATGIINKLETYSGCILADSVGLGKTFTALAVIKYYELRNRSVLVLCPKKLADNWLNYNRNLKTNIFARDRFNYDVLCHTDLSRTSGESFPPEERTARAILDSLDFDFFELLDSVTIARSRKHIQTFYDTKDIGQFPERRKPLSFHCPLTERSDVLGFNEIFEQLSLLKLAVYAPISYILPSRLKKYEEIYDTKVGGKGTLRQADREKSLQALMTVNLLKRLESSVQSFRLTLQSLRANNEATFTKIAAFNQSGGAVTVGDLTDGYLLTLDEGPDGDSEEEPSGQNLPWFRVSFSLGIPAADFERTVSNLAELVGLRNDLVHHFLENYDIGTEGGCQRATSYLENCTKQIEHRLEELRSWAKGANEVRERAAALYQSPEFEEFFVHGILPGGAGVNWACCTIVNLLRDAEEAHARDGWTLLQDAINFSRATEPDHGPSRYGCRSWRQVVHESGQFEIRKWQLKAGEPRAIWYRSKPASA